MRSKLRYLLQATLAACAISVLPVAVAPAGADSTIVERDARVAMKGSPDRVGFAVGSAERLPVCSEGPAFHFLYAHLSNSSDRFIEMEPKVRGIIGRMDAMLNAASLASGGPNADYRAVCDPTGQVAIDSFATTGLSLSEVTSSARAAGFDSATTKYVVFVDGGNGVLCGVSSMLADDRLAEDNKNNFGGVYAAIYNECWFRETAMHESAHLMGAVQPTAPHSTGTTAHCYDENDVLCYAPDGGELHQEGTETLCPGAMQFDCGFDDYFDSAPEPGEYLDAHWNLGSPLNHFLAFGVPGAEPASAPEPPTWHRLRFQVSRDAQSVNVVVQGGGDLALYLRRGHSPTESRFTCRSRPDDGPRRCVVRNPSRGRWVAGVLAPAGKAPGRIRVRAAVSHKPQSPGPRTTTQFEIFARTTTA